MTWLDLNLPQVDLTSFYSSDGVARAEVPNHIKADEGFFESLDSSVRALPIMLNFSEISVEKKDKILWFA